MKTKITLGLMMAIFMMPITYVHAGVGVGNGGEGDHAAYIEKLKQELGVLDRRSESQTPIKADDLYEWCSRVTRLLKRELMRANRQIEQDQLLVAKQILKDALIIISESLHLDPSQASPMTKKLIDRGVIYIDALDQEFEQGTIRDGDTLTILLFLTGYVDLILNTEETLDRPWYIPYYYSGGRRDHEHFDFLAFSQKYLWYAKTQLSFLANHFSRLERRNGEMVVTPIGNPRAFLKLSELGTFFVADDIANTLEAYRHACLVLDLKLLSEMLRDFNVFKDRSVFSTVPQALSQTRSALDHALQDLSGYISVLKPDQFETWNVLGSRLYVTSGQVESVNLGEPRYVQKLTIQAQAQRSEAIMEVLANGEVKGTIHLPARDPSYVVTVAAVTDSIELRHVSGGTVEVISIQSVQQPPMSQPYTFWRNQR